MIGEVRYGARRLGRSPGFAILATGIVALAVGSGTAVFRVANAVLLRPLAGVRDAGRLVTFYRTQKGDSFDNFGYPDYLDFRSRSRTLASVAAHSGTTVNFRCGATERVRADLVTDNYFAVLGVRAATGRLIGREEDSAVAVLGYDFWQRRFGGRAEAVGARIALNGFPFTVIGITPRDFHGTVAGVEFDLWTPMESQPQTIPRLSAGVLRNRASGWIEVFGRLQPGIAAARADAEMKTIAGQLAREYPVSNGSRSVTVIPGLGWYPDERAEASGLLRTLSNAVALLSLIACANLAGLFLLRGSARQREIALRLAIGAGRGQAARMLVTEGLMIALAGGTIGLVLSQWAAGWMAALRPSSAVRNLDVGIDWRVLAFALAASLAAGVLFALLPALRSAPRDLTAALKQGSAGAGLRRTRGRAALLVAQTAVSFVLLAAAGALGRNLIHLLTADPGYAMSNIAIGAIDLTLDRYPEDRGIAIYRQLLERLPALPGVVSATLASSVPPAEWPGRESIFHPGEEPPPEVFQGRSMELGLRVDIDTVAPGYFGTMGIRLLAGRDFTLRDGADTPLVAIVNQALAGRMWPGANPIGKRFAWPQWGAPRRTPVEVIGLADDTRSRALGAAAVPLLYAPALQNYGGRTLLVARTRGNPGAILTEMGRLVGSIDPNVALFGRETMERHVAESLWAQRMAAAWLGSFSLLALGLTGVGLYGMMAQSLTQRRREMGIRMALGAARGAISRLMLWDCLLLAGTGMGMGLPAAAAVGYWDWRVCLASATILVTALLAAGWIPARRATQIDPAAALRAE